MRKNYNCETCQKFIPVDHSALKQGQRVKFVVTSGTKYIRFSSQEGVIQSIEGVVATISHGKKVITRLLCEVTPADAPSPLAYAMSGTCECKGVSS